MVEQIVEFIRRKGDVYPLYPNQCQAGFPANIDDLPAEDLDLAEYIVKNPCATFFVRATGDSMIDAGIFADDLLVVDRSAEAETNDIVIAVINNEFTVKRLAKNGKKIELRSENPDYPSISIPEGTELQIWGVVKFAIHAV